MQQAFRGVIELILRLCLDVLNLNRRQLFGDPRLNVRFELIELRFVLVRFGLQLLQASHCPLCFLLLEHFSDCNFDSVLNCRVEDLVLESILQSNL